MRVLALDFGRKRIGVAIGDSTDGIAFPREPLGNTPELLQHLLDLVNAEGIEHIIVGLPLNLQGEEAQIVAPAREFADALEDALLAAGLPIPVDFCDERFTSILATQAARASGLTDKDMRGQLDSAAAAILLVGYFAARESNK